MYELFFFGSCRFFLLLVFGGFWGVGGLVVVLVYWGVGWLIFKFFFIVFLNEGECGIFLDVDVEFDFFCLILVLIVGFGVFGFVIIGLFVIFFFFLFLFCCGLEFLIIVLIVWELLVRLLLFIVI